MHDDWTFGDHIAKVFVTYVRFWTQPRKKLEKTLQLFMESAKVTITICEKSLKIELWRNFLFRELNENCVIKLFQYI